MAFDFSRRKTQLTITRVLVTNEGSVTVMAKPTFKTMLNPTEFKHKRAICYNTKMVLGQIASQTKFAGIQPDTVNFAILLDGTGVVRQPQSDNSTRQSSETVVDVIEQVKQLNEVVYNYESSKHEPGHVQLLWGTLILYGRLQSMSIQYTLFKPSGDPLRAKVDMEFTGFMSTQEAERKANRSSPDLSHLVEVREGDTLPLLCNRIYGDPSYYREVAHFNGLDNFRRLTPGQRLHFPPLG